MLRASLSIDARGGHMHPEDIKAGLRKRGNSLSAIARSLGVNRAAVSQALHAPTSRRIDEAIARALGLPLRSVWPGRYPARRARR